MFDLLVLAALALVDPVGDTHGAGDLNPPTAPMYGSLAPFDLVEVAVLDEARLTVEIRLADIPNALDLPLGLSLTVIDVYVDTAEGGETMLLPGPGLRMPDRVGWEFALRVHGDDAYLVDALDEGSVREPLSVRRVGNRIILSSMRRAPERVRRVDAVTGVYDAFSADAWREVSTEPSPWAFSSPTGALPVVDVLAATGTAQRSALERGELPLRARAAVGVAAWLALATVGVIVGFIGLFWRWTSLPQPRGEGGDEQLIEAMELSEWTKSDSELDAVTDSGEAWRGEGVVVGVPPEASARVRGGDGESAPPPGVTQPTQDEVGGGWTWERGVKQGDDSTFASFAVADAASPGPGVGNDSDADAVRPPEASDPVARYRVRKDATGIDGAPVGAGDGAKGDSDDRHDGRDP